MTSGGQEAGCSRSQFWAATLEGLSCALPVSPTCTPTLSISLLKMFPFLFSLYSALPLLFRLSFSPLPSFPISLLLSSIFILLFILSSPPRPLSVTLIPSFSHSSPSPRPSTGKWGNLENLLTRNTPTPASSISCDGSGGSESPCAPANP